MIAFDSSRRFAHDLVDLLFDHVGQIDTLPAVEWKPEEELRELVRLGDATADPLELARLVVRWSNHFHHPGYMGHQVCPPLNDAATADLLISFLNQSTAVWEMIRSGKAWITTTVLRAERVLRVTMMNPRTTEAHVDAMLDALREL